MPRCRNVMRCNASVSIISLFRLNTSVFVIPVMKVRVKRSGARLSGVMVLPGLEMLGSGKVGRC